MLEKITDRLFQKYSKEDYMGIFLAGFSSEDILLSSHGVLYANKSLKKTVELIYQGLLKKHIDTIAYCILDVVIEYVLVDDIEELKKLDMQNYGICLLSKKTSKSGAILPNTIGVENIGEALKLVKEKNGLDGKVDVYSFRTDRFVVYG